jgi:C1A family cysteine protease
MLSLLFCFLTFLSSTVSAHNVTQYALANTFSLVPSPYPTFQAWQSLYGKEYLSATERDYREYMYTRNVRKIARHNAKGLSWTMAVNQFADLSKGEFAERYLTGANSGGYNNATHLRAKNYDWSLLRTNLSALPSSVDWTTKGAVTPVKDQGQCGSCWSFSATGALEGAWFVSRKVLTNLSEQQLVDCSTAEGNQGCNGGLMDYAFQYAKVNGLTSESSYPYSATGPNACKASGLPVLVKATGFTDVPTNSQTALMTAVVRQPVSVAIEADQNAFQFYSSGVLTKACGTNLDHGVLLVGYGTQSGLDYYKVKNSWGTTWGQGGYVLLGRGPSYNGNQGQCGIQMDPSFPVV